MRGPRLAFTLSLVLVDAAMSFLAFFIAYAIRRLTSETPIGPFGDYVLLAGIQTVATVAVFFSYKF